MEEQYQEVTQDTPILDDKYTDSIPTLGESIPEHVTGVDRTSQTLNENRDALYEGKEVPRPSHYIHRPDEPFFFLLGRDPQAPDLIDHWANVREIAEPGDWKIKDARRIARDMRVFKAANPDFGMAKDLYLTATSTELSRLDQALARAVEQLRRLHNETSANAAADHRDACLSPGLKG